MAYCEDGDYASATDSSATVRQTDAAPYFSNAALAFRRALMFDEPHPTAANAQIALTLNSIAQDDIQTYRNALSDFLAGNPTDERIPALRESFTLLDECENQRKKSPLLAGGLSTCLAGGGQVYAQHDMVG